METNSMTVRNLIRENREVVKLDSHHNLQQMNFKQWREDMEPTEPLGRASRDLPGGYKIHYSAMVPTGNLVIVTKDYDDHTSECHSSPEYKEVTWSVEFTVEEKRV